MPIMDGFEFLDRFRHLPQCQGVPVIVWTVKDLTVEEYARLQKTVVRVVAKGHAGANAVTAELRAFLGIKSV
jgi:CheY-like chemotaxis protein